MTRKHTRRRVIVPMPPRGLRPKLTHDQVIDLGLVHMANLDAIATGRGTEEILWQWVGGLFTWSRAAELLGLGLEEIEPQLQMAAEVINRYGRTGRVGFTGAEYQLAKFGVQVMDALAEQVDRATAVAAAEWSEQKVNMLAASSRRREGQTA